MHTIVWLLVVGFLPVQGAPDSSVTLPPELVVRSTTINGQQASYRLVDVSIHVWRVFNSGDEARLVIGGAGPTAFYDEGGRRSPKSFSSKIPIAELTALVDSLDLGWLASQESSINYGPRGESVRDFYNVRAQELTLVVRIGEYRKSLTWSSYRSEKNLELPAGISNLLIQLEQSPTVMRAVSEVGIKLSSNTPLQPAPAEGVD